MSDEWPRFWFEPWRWADPGWHRRYGVPLASPGLPAARLLCAGWTGAFGLEREWRPPADRRWLQLLGIAPLALRDLAAVLGWIAVLRAPGGMAQVRGAERDPLLRCALRYRDVNCIEARIGGSRDAACDARESGLHLLRLAAEAQWPDIAPRLGMMRAPDAAHQECRLAIARIDAGLCVALGLAAARRLGATIASPAGVGAGVIDRAEA
jgi:hypothetical protein